MTKTMTKSAARSTSAFLVGGCLFVGAWIAACGSAAALSPRDENGTNGGGDPRPTALTAVYVMDIDPQATLGGSRTAADLASNGPFPAYDTQQVWIVMQWDRRRVGSGSFDQRVTLTLPDGHIYQRFVMPVDPHGLGGSIDRPEISPVSIGIAPMQRNPALAKKLTNPGQAKLSPAKYVAYTQLPLPVAGTWITQHNLFGLWNVKVEAVRDGQVFAVEFATFRFDGR